MGEQQGVGVWHERRAVAAEGAVRAAKVADDRRPRALADNERIGDLHGQRRGAVVVER